VSDFELTDFEILQQLPAREHRELFEAVQRERRQAVQLTVFSPEMSRRVEFRRALKMDRAVLSMLQHQSIVPYLGSGESGGQLFLCSEPCEFDSLAVQLKSGRILSSEDVIEIGWQICSALQQAHNLGLAHGGLGLDSVLLSDNLQVMLMEFGVARWLKAAQDSPAISPAGPALITISALASREQVQGDLKDLAAILLRLLQAVPESGDVSEAGKMAVRAPLERLLARVTSANPAMHPVSAREFQGRLGEILIGSDDDSMPLVDQREFSSGSKRSIVVELFEPTESIEQLLPSSGKPAASAWQLRILPILVTLVLLVLIALAAGLLS
jgi:serine/threonine protein kinase